MKTIFEDVAHFWSGLSCSSSWWAHSRGLGEAGDMEVWLYDGPAGGEFYDFVHRAGSATISGRLLWSVCFLVLHLGANFGIDASGSILPILLAWGRGRDGDRWKGKLFALCWDILFASHAFWHHGTYCQYFWTSRLQQILICQALLKRIFQLPPLQSSWAGWWVLCV